MKSNSCDIYFICDTNDDCVYSTEKSNSKCKYHDVNYYDDNICKSKVAQANAIKGVE